MTLVLDFDFELRDGFGDPVKCKLVSCFFINSFTFFDVTLNCISGLYINCNSGKHSGCDCNRERFDTNDLVEDNFFRRMSRS